MSAEAHLQNGFALLSWLLTAKLSTSGPPGWGWGAPVVGQPSLPNSRMEAGAGRSPQQPLRPPPFHLVQETGHRTAKVPPASPPSGWVSAPPIPHLTEQAVRVLTLFLAEPSRPCSKQHVPKSITESISTAFLGCHLL